MKVILVLGAGRSSSVLISYLLAEAREHDWQIMVGDLSEAAARERVGNSTIGKALRFDVTDERSCRLAISHATVVLSLLPPPLHPVVARYCVELGKHLITASYVSNEMRQFDDEAKRKSLLFLNECGLDPGIDHMSVMQVLNAIKDRKGKVISVESFTGGLIAPETDPGNPWRYKFTWNPRNVVMAGQGTAKFLQEGSYKYIPYQQLFTRTIGVNVEGHMFEGYANRDSLSYQETYDLTEIKTMLRGTLREKGYCSAWNIFVQLGCCDDSYIVSNVNEMTHRDFITSFVDDTSSASVQEKIARQCHVALQGSELEKLTWSGFFSDERVGLATGTPAQILEHILNKKWKLEPNDKDLIVMWHRFIYEVDNKRKEIQASLVVVGDNAVDTAMAKTVGLPLGIAAGLLLKGMIAVRGVVIPVQEEIYGPILRELKNHGVTLIEKEIQ